MVKVPGFLLKRLYVKGSLRNTEGGFRLSLKNTLGSGYAQGLMPLTVDGEAMPLEDSYFFVEHREVPFAEVSKETPFALGMNREASMLVKGKTLAPGPHKVGLGFSVVGLGPISFEIADVVAAEHV